MRESYTFHDFLRQVCSVYIEPSVNYFIVFKEIQSFCYLIAIITVCNCTCIKFSPCVLLSQQILTPWHYFSLLPRKPQILWNVTFAVSLYIHSRATCEISCNVLNCPSANPFLNHRCILFQTNSQIAHVGLEKPHNYIGKHVLKKPAVLSWAHTALYCHRHTNTTCS